MAGRGLASDEPLDFDTIIKSLYSNPDRLKYPELWNKQKCRTCWLNWSTLLPLNIEINNDVPYKTLDSAEFFISKTNELIPDSKADFNEACIRLWDMSKLYVNDGELGVIITDELKTDRENYLKSLKTFKWFGPFKNSIYH